MAKPRLNFIRSFLLHPGSWVLLALITLAIGLIITAAAPGLLVATAFPLAVIIVAGLVNALVSLFLYARSYWIKLDTIERETLIEGKNRTVHLEKNYKIALWPESRENFVWEKFTVYITRVEENKNKIQGQIFYGHESWRRVEVSVEDFADLEKCQQFQTALKQPNIIEALVPLLPEIVTISRVKSLKKYPRILIGLLTFLGWLIGIDQLDKKPHPWQVFFVSLGVIAFITALVLTIGFFTGGGAFVVVGGVMAATGGGAFAFMGSVFAPIAGIFAASSIAAFTTPFCVAFMSGLLFTLAPLNLIANTPKRLLSFFGGLKDSAEHGNEDRVEDGGLNRSHKEDDKQMPDANPNNNNGDRHSANPLARYMPTQDDYYSKLPNAGSSSVTDPTRNDKSINLGND